MKKINLSHLWYFKLDLDEPEVDKGIIIPCDVENNLKKNYLLVTVNQCVIGTTHRVMAPLKPAIVKRTWTRRIRCV